MRQQEEMERQETSRPTEASTLALILEASFAVIWLLQIAPRPPQSVLQNMPAFSHPASPRTSPCGCTDDPLHSDTSWKIGRPCSTTPPASALSVKIDLVLSAQPRLAPVKFSQKHTAYDYKAFLYME